MDIVQLTVNSNDTIMYNVLTQITVVHGLIRLNTVTSTVNKRTFTISEVNLPTLN